MPDEEESDSTLIPADQGNQDDLEGDPFQTDEPFFDEIEDEPPRQNRLGRLRSALGEIRSDIGRRVRTTDFGAIRGDVFNVVVNPKFLPKKFTEVDRGAQWASAIILPFVIVASFAILTAWGELLSDIFSNGDWASFETIMAFMFTLLNLAAFAIAIWFWFLFVRTAGFGLFGN